MMSSFILLRLLLDLTHLFLYPSSKDSAAHCNLFDQLSNLLESLLHYVIEPWVELLLSVG